MRKLTLAERESIYNNPASEIKESAGLVIENGEIVGVEE
jgi:hypothetical protein